MESPRLGSTSSPDGITDEEIVPDDEAVSDIPEIELIIKVLVEFYLLNSLTKKFFNLFFLCDLTITCTNIL